jgi:biofilm PGA synthesis N-glycosyltransferase PgaC
MSRRSRIFVGGLAVAACSGHVLYPAWLAVASRRIDGKASSAPDPSPWPPVTVLVAAFREAGVIASKVKDVQGNGYPGSIEVLVVADGDADTATAAEEAGARVLTGPQRQGKAQALNQGFSVAHSPIVVISDANNRLVPGALAALVRHFHDPTIGAVAGAKVEDDGGGESLYWKFESWLKQRESALGTTIGVVGELTAFRAAAWEDIPEDVAIDDLWTALDLSARGWRIAYEPEAKAIDPPASSLSDQWERRTRSVANALYVFVRQRRQLGPSGGLVAAEVWGHRLGRYTVSPLAHLLLLGISISRLRSSAMARVFLLGHIAGIGGLFRPPRTGRLWRLPLVLAGQVLFLQAVALGGLVRYARGDRRTTWTTAER